MGTGLLPLRCLVCLECHRLLCAPFPDRDRNDHSTQSTMSKNEGNSFENSYTKPSDTDGPTSFLKLKVKTSDKAVWVRAAARSSERAPRKSAKLADWVINTLNEAADKLRARDG